MKIRAFQKLKFLSIKHTLFIWDFIVTLLHEISFRLLPKTLISFGMVGLSGIFVQLVSTEIQMRILDINFTRALPFSVLIAATSNYLINNILTFRSNRLQNYKLIQGLIKFLFVVSLPVIGNIFFAVSFYREFKLSTFWAQICGIVIIFIWNYIVSTKFVWKNSK